MKYKNVAEMAVEWNVSERNVRNYCSEGRVPGALLDGEVWRIPENAKNQIESKGAGRYLATF